MRKNLVHFGTKRDNKANIKILPSFTKKNYFTKF